jgi:hypothetical protein
MIKFNAIVKGTSATLLAALGLIMIFWAHGRSAPPPTRGETDLVKAVKLRLIFEGGDAANVTEVEGGTITIEKDGKKLAITPFIRDPRGQVELRVFQVSQSGGKEVMQTLETRLVDKDLTKLKQGSLPLSVQVLDADKRLPADFSATTAATCCARTCAGTLVCGLCVCTDCGFCATVHWCDCNPPGPASTNPIHSN